MAANNRLLARFFLVITTVIGLLLASKAASADPWTMEVKTKWEGCLQKGGAKSSEECKQVAARMAWQEAEMRKAAQRIPEVAACFNDVANKAAQRGQGSGRLDNERRADCNACWSMYYGRLAYMLHMGRKAKANGQALSDLASKPIVPPEAIVCAPSAVWEGQDPLVEAELAGVDVERRLHGLQREVISRRFAAERVKLRMQQISQHAALNPELHRVTAYDDVERQEATSAIAQSEPKPKRKRSSAELLAELEAMAKKQPAKPQTKKPQTADDVYADLDQKPATKKPAEPQTKKPQPVKKPQPKIAAKPGPAEKPVATGKPAADVLTGPEADAIRACLPRGMFIPREASKEKLVLAVLPDAHATLAALQAAKCIADKYETLDVKVFRANRKIATFPICAKFSPSGRYLVQHFDPERMSAAAIRKMTPDDPANFDFAVACELGELPRGDTFRIALQAGQRLTLLAKAENETSAPPAPSAAPPVGGENKPPGVEQKAPPDAPSPAPTGWLQLSPEDHPGAAYWMGGKSDPEPRGRIKNLDVHSASSVELEAGYSLVPWRATGVRAKGRGT